MGIRCVVTNAKIVVMREGNHTRVQDRQTLEFFLVNVRQIGARDTCSLVETSTHYSLKSVLAQSSIASLFTSGRSKTFDALAKSTTNNLTNFAARSSIKGLSFATRTAWASKVARY
jgi:hypothetical protein